MAGIQLGDIVNFGRIAWDVYKNGWSDERNATKQYIEFGRDVKGLAENLDILTRVVSQANASLRQQGVHNSAARWDPTSLGQIVGDYRATLEECNELIKSNNRYRAGSTPFRNIEWNLLIQPTADQLRQRIALHNSKVVHVLKPFEIDLLCRVRQDIYQVHQDLAQRISHVHHDIRRLMGVLVPDLQQALDQQAQRNICILDVPMELAEKFRLAALTDRPEYENDEEFELQELSDAFVLNYNRSTINFNASLVVANRIPPLDQYVNLLKCVWLFRRIQASPSLQNGSSDSHWPSYVDQLENDLSAECIRFSQDLVKPELNPLSMKRDLLTIWPEREPSPLVDVVTRDEMMEQLLEMPLQSPAINVDQKLKLLRRQGSDGRRFRVMITGVEQIRGATRPRKHTEVIDFDITSAILNPLYAIPATNGAAREMILKRDERIARLRFTHTSDMFKFQQAVIGFKPWASHTQYSAMVSFVVAGRKEPMVEKACIQLWIPKQTDGSLVTTSSEADEEANSNSNSSRSPSVGSSAVGTIPVPRSGGGGGGGFRQTSPVFTDVFGRSPESASSISMGQRASAQSPILGGPFSTSPRQSSPAIFASSSPERNGLFTIPARRPVGQSPSPRRQSTLATTISSARPSSGLAGTRTLSISSTAGVSNNSSSGSEPYSTTISTGSKTTGFLHKRPPKPLLVIYSQEPKDGKLSFATIQIDEETSINPERCNCRRAGSEGSSCPIAAIERKKGEANLSARRYESSSTSSSSQSGGGGDMEWNLAQLARNNPVSTSDTTLWANVKRVSIMFPNPVDRAKFGGTPNQCQCRVRSEGEMNQCLRAGHRGLWGEVQEFYRLQGNDYHKARYEGQQQVVNGLMS